MPSPAVTRSRRDTLRREIGFLRDLPTPSRVIHEIWRVMADENASAQALAEVLQRDTALAARTLRLANSAYFGLPEPVADVRAACVVLGFETVRGIAVGVAALESFARTTGNVLDVRAFWRHSVGVATASHAIARRLGIPETGTAFCAGMLHDLGRLALASVAGPTFRRIDLGADAPPLREQEVELFGASHDEVGGWIAERWKLPGPLAEAIRDHHEPLLGEEGSRWASLVHVGDVLAHRHGLAGIRVERPVEAPVPGRLAILGLSADALVGIEAAFPQELERVEAFAIVAQGDA